MLVAGHVFQDEKVVVAFDRKLDDADDALVFELDLDVGFAREQVAQQRRLALAGSLRGQRLDRHLLFIFGEKRAFGEIDFAHPPFADFRNDSITADDFAYQIFHHFFFTFAPRASARL